MEFQEEFRQMMKGKRTKRKRQLSMLALAMDSTSSSGSENSSGGGFDHTAMNTSTTNSTAITDCGVQEEEDMANCLILLAHGETRKTLTYLCKTCDRCFPSFQALGGHRASHNKPNKSNIPNGEDNKTLMKIKQGDRHDNTSIALSVQIPNSRVSLSTVTKSRVHECSICGEEFFSGQALGGHMRRHRTASTARTTSSGDEIKAVKKSRNYFALDLNLPAPEELEFVSASEKQLIVLSANSLVDCHH